MKSTETILLSRQQVAELLSVKECIAAIEGMFNFYGKGEALKPGILGIHAPLGGFHIKAGLLQLESSCFVAKINANFPQNPALHSLPTIQGVVAVFDGNDGRLLALMDSIEITILRTGAATAVAAKYLAKEGSRTVTICGCGNQGRISLRCLAHIFRLETVFAYDTDRAAAQAFAKEMTQEFSFSVVSTDDLRSAARQSDICITGTTSKKAFLGPADVRPGTFIAAVGADSEEKQELMAELVAAAKVVADVLDQSAAIGELHHALDKRLMTKDQVYGELGQVVAGRLKGRESDDEIIIFDSTGMALQDVVSAAIVYEKASERGMGLRLNFAG